MSVIIGNNHGTRVIGYSGGSCFVYPTSVVFLIQGHNSDYRAILVNGDKKARTCSFLQHSPTAFQEVLMVPMLATLTLQVVQ